MSMYRQLSSTYNSVANPVSTLAAIIAVDGDVHLSTFGLSENGAHHNADIRLRTYSGGGRNLLLHKIMLGLVSRNDEVLPGQLDFFDELYAAGIPNRYDEFVIGCDDNPGSNLKIAIADELFGLQTNCHDEKADHESGGFMSRQGDGPMVWLHRNMLPKVYADLKSYLVDKRQADKDLYGSRAFNFLRLEA